MKLLSHELTHVYQQKAGVSEEMTDYLRKDRLVSRTSLIVMMGSSSYQMKTAAAELAKKLGKRLYRIDLSSVSSKYIGETEKNIDAIFDSASASGWILFFDEADALFGKRTNIKDAHDRYANLETNYLLRKMERYRGIIILSANHPSRVLKKISRIRKVIVKFPPFGG